MNVQATNGLHIGFAEIEVEDVDVLLHSFNIGGFRNHRDALLN